MAVVAVLDGGDFNRIVLLILFPQICYHFPLPPLSAASAPHETGGAPEPAADGCAAQGCKALPRPPCHAPAAARQVPEARAGPARAAPRAAGAALPKAGGGLPVPLAVPRCLPSRALAEASQRVRGGLAAQLARVSVRTRAV